MGALTTGVELGIQRPAVSSIRYISNSSLILQVGQEEEWLASNREHFERLADEGDEDMQALVESLKAKE